jgi:hypothetical protein
MQSRAGELNPYQGERQPSLGWRQAKAAARLVRGSGTLLGLALLSGLATIAVLALALLVGSVGTSPYFGTDFLLNIAVAGCVLSAVTFCAVAASAAVDADVDAMPLRLGEALREAAARRGAVLGWAALGTAVWIAWHIAARVGGGALAVVVFASLVFYVCAFFVQPVIAVDDAGPLEALSESLQLMRERGWAAFGGLVGMGTTTAVLWFTLWLISQHGVAEQRLHGDGLALILIVDAVGIFVAALFSVTRAAFATYLFREASGDLPLGCYEGPRRSRGQKGLRVVGAVIVSLFLIGIVSSATKGDRLVNNQGPGGYFTVSVSDLSASELESGSPVVFGDSRIGTVLEVDQESSGSKVSIHLDPGYGPETTPGYFEVVDYLGRAGLALTESGGGLPEDAQTL